ncbi:MAG: hypothetical protein A3C30_03005 [Candidatus Levybacteria bacterium RIFCSPHIGHO2_02_FULL_40_18]|nr:MAG: hypothetical protein A2869_04975 [Candidatus Levybacteria bacterium RIFCSPHIGHO2_01_FULL_40_58]OGH26944.1 MAG: hypothetical protein A3C30_03005 [Candidatus Levybacteria bacterium RIFCSPHIGHO2_02_FULL_40_18]OGH32066.1 MAG: hypothetical protein A3E43_03985 [Candidatus Levybacteria bacterium RIFCSPHIGHO2_12_FULL_40_31]OGH40812.1 MAG: hypothetical protein A2894_04415 [Candidatus Levybacteria bacterium RIFCSPLOWO2_01_FULL_40_64]OGH48668.1 MAG: hypothetical protein A3I54_03345 [Candidatus Lev
MKKTTRVKNIAGLLGKPTAEFEKFHSKTKIKKLARNLPRPSWPKEWGTIYYKGYARFEEIRLPKPTFSKRVTFAQALRDRKSTREFSKEPIGLGELNSFLYYSAGLNKNSDFAQRRFYPSGGARFPLEVYILSLNMDLPKGVYHYYVKTNSLEKLTDFKKKNLKLLTSVPFAKNAGCLIIITAIFKRNTIKYGDRGYRHVLVEAGHLAQNFYLLASALGLGICGVGGYMDDNVNRLLDVDGLDETVVYMLGVGNKAGGH